MQAMSNSGPNRYSQDALVSVIVPVYKVEKYLRRCLDSIIGQSHQNMQIILVDDGSPDLCGSICDEYASRDGRITAIHQENKGLAAARNTGLKSVSGDWIAWVDADDWVEPDYVHALLKEAIVNHADIVICGRYEDYSKRSVYYGVNQKLCLNQNQALLMLLKDEEIRNYMWDKLWHADLFRNIRFPEGRNFEDMAVCYKLFLNAQCIVCLPDSYYHYTVRNTSIIHDEDIRNLLGRIEALSSRYIELSGLYPEWITELGMDRMRIAISLKANYRRYGIDQNKECRNLLRELSQYYRSHPIDKNLLKNEGLAGRIVMELVPYDTWWSYAAAALTGWLYKLKNGKRI